MAWKRREVVQKADVGMSEVGCIEYCLDRQEVVSLNKGRPVYSARVVEKEVYYLDDTIERMLASGCVVSESVVRLVLKEYFKMVETLVKQGRAVSIPGMVRFAPAIRGTFDSPEEDFDPKKHKIVVNATISKNLHKVAADSPTRRIEVKGSAPLMNKEAKLNQKVEKLIGSVSPEA